MQVFLHNSLKLNHFASILYIFSSFLLIIFALNARACEDFFSIFSFPQIRCSLRSRLCRLYLSVELFIFVTRYGKNDVCHSWHTSIIRERLFELLLHQKLHDNFCRIGNRGSGAEDGGNTGFVEEVIVLRGAASTVTLLSVRTPEFLLCSFYALARSESLWCPVPTHTPRPCPSSRLFCATSARSLYLSHIPLSEKNQIKNLQSC